MKTNRQLQDPTLEELWAIRRDLAREIPTSAEQRFAYYAHRERQRGAKLFRPETASIQPSGLLRVSDPS